MIDRSHKLSVSRQASLLGISRGAVYYLPKPIGESDLRIMHAMDRLHLDFPFMGSRQLTRTLRQQGYRVGRLHVRTLMIKMGISAIAPQPGTSKRNGVDDLSVYMIDFFGEELSRHRTGLGKQLRIPHAYR